MSTQVARRAVLAAAARGGAAGVLGAWAGPASAAAPALPRSLTTSVSAATGPSRGRRTVGASVAYAVGLSRTDGAAVGELVVSGTVLAARGPAATTAAVHHHLLRLPGGTLAGHGTVDLVGRGEFVVLGGTGTYRGASGAYRLEPGPGGGSTLTWEA